jgi:hypothetical protein
MESRPIYEYIYFGTTLRYLLDAEEGWSIHGNGFVIDQLEHLFKTLDEFSLPVTQEGTWEIRATANALRETAEDAQLTSEQAVKMVGELDRVRHTLYAESSLNIAYVVTEKRIDVKKLLRDVSGLMAPGVYKALPEMARHDLNEAAKAIAFELPTAAAFLALRGAEDVLRHFYRCVVRQRRLTTLLWGPMVAQMREKKSRRPEDALLDVLDRIRVNFRNPTSHPDAVYDIHEAQDLFLAVLEAVRRMVQSPLWASET